MDKLKTAGYYCILVVSALLIIVSGVSLFYNNTSIWWIKSLNFPRLQFFLAAIFCLLLLVAIKRKRTAVDWVLMAGISFIILLHAWYVLPYTPITKEEVPSVSAGQVDTSRKVSFLIANVYMKNRKAETLANMIKEQNPDIVFLMETDQWWERQLRPIRNNYPYAIVYPLNNTYGFLLYSRYPLTDSSIMFLEHPEVPSVHTRLTLPNHQAIMFYGIHPVPPVPSKYPDNIGEKAGELAEVAEIVAKEKLPVVVAGDFNDVAWSKTSRLFYERSQLKDVRAGRGLYNSFDATSFLFRWPLDHFFVTKEFRLITLERLGKFGSDHFPVYVELALQN